MPGLTTKTSIPNGYSSVRKAWLSPRRANLLALYSLICEPARCPRIDAIFTTIGRLPCRNSGNASRVISAAAKKLTSKIFRSRSGSAMSNRPVAPIAGVIHENVEPAEFLDGPIQRRLPNRRIGDIAGDPFRRPAAAANLVGDGHERSSRRASSTTRDPCRANSTAIARPIPPEAPVTNERKPAILRKDMAEGARG